uniref:Uncharacterized protein n=1 Tax=Palpitomonas bilix TaxID=652834 RepID=A0A7S3D8B8_9EUKA|mmetsp:Transcript_26512/g.67852  ORF Transcript_26512/g.67852 Transcript_26512/m.67852 type:complete len:1002 (+) Transcript_26512:113-3118(+)
MQLWMMGKMICFTFCLGVVFKKVGGTRKTTSFVLESFLMQRDPDGILLFSQIVSTCDHLLNVFGQRGVEKETEANKWRKQVVEALTASTLCSRQEKIKPFVQKLNRNPNECLKAFQTCGPESLPSLFTSRHLKQRCNEEGHNALHFLAANANQDDGIIEGIRKLITEEKLKPDQGDRDENITPVHIAAMYGNCKTLEVLLKEGAGANHKTSRGCSALWFACLGSHLECAKWLLERGGANVEGNDGLSCLFLASCIGDIDLCRLLLRHGADSLRKERTTHMTPLMGACKNGNEEVVALLLAEGGACATDRDRKGRSALWQACVRGHLSCVRLLLTRGVRANEPVLNSEVQKAEKEGRGVETPLIGACRAGHPEVVQLLLAHGACAEGNHDLETPLLTASEGGHVDVCRRLIDAGADVNRVARGTSAVLAAVGSLVCELVEFLISKGADLNPNNTCNNALSRAVFGNNQEMVRLVLKRGGKCSIGKYHPLVICAETRNTEMARFLIEQGIQVTSVTGPVQPLASACAFDNPELIDLFLAEGADPNGDCIAGQNALFAAAASGNVGVVTKLIDHGAHADGHLGSGLPLSMAIQNGHFDVVRCLVTKGAKVNVPSQPLLLAIDKGHSDMVLFLLEAGAHPNLSNGKKQSALYKASLRGDTSVVEALLSKGASVNEWDGDCSPVTAAAQRGHDDVLRRLVCAGADVNLSDDQGVTPLHVAVENSRVSCTKLLLEKGGVVQTTEGAPLLLDMAFDTEEINEEIVMLLMHHGAPTQSNVPLVCRAAKKSKTMIDLLLRDRDIPLQETDSDGNGPLHYAVGSFDVVDVIEYLVERGCDLEAKNPKGMTALYLAVVKQNVQAVSALLEAGADPSSLQTRIDGHRPAEICANNSMLRPLLSDALSAEGRVRQSKVLAARRKRKRTSEPSGGPSEMPLREWSHSDVMDWIRQEPLHMVVTKILSRHKDFDGTRLLDVTFSELVTLADMPEFSAYRLIQFRDRLVKSRKEREA